MYIVVLIVNIGSI